MVTSNLRPARKGAVADRANAVLARFGEKSLDAANFWVVENDAGEIVAAACGIAPVAGDTAILGEFRFRTGGVSARANLAAFREVLKAHVSEADDMGFKFGEAVVSDRTVVRFVERLFRIKAEVFGTTGGVASQWRFVVELKPFLKQLTETVSG